MTTETNTIKIGNRTFYTPYRMCNGTRFINGKGIAFSTFNALSYGGAEYAVTVYADGWGEAISHGNHKRYTGRVA